MSASEIFPLTRLFAGVALATLAAWPPAAQAGGHLDGSYGSGGYFLTAPPGDPGAGTTVPVSEYTAVAIAAGGELYSVGFGPDDTCVVVAVDAVGQEVPAWGGDAAAGIPCWERDLRPAVAVQSDGRVIVAYAGGWQRLFLRRWRASGEPDLAFGEAGLVAVDIPFVLYGEPRILAALDGSIVVAVGGRAAGSGCPGHVCNDAPARLGAFRLAADGSLAATHFDLPPPDSARVPAILGVAARPQGDFTAVVRGSQAGDTPSSCLAYYGYDSVTFIDLAVDGTYSRRVACWNADYPDGAVELGGATLYAAAYDDDAGGYFLNRFDLDGRRQGDPVRLAGLSGLIGALGVGPSDATYVEEHRYDWLSDDVSHVRTLLRVYRPDGQPEPSFVTAGVDHAVPLSARALRVAPAGRLTVAALFDDRLGAVRLSLGDGGHPGRLGIAARHALGETGSLVGRSDGYSQSTTINQRDTTLDFVVDRTGGSEGPVSVAYRIDGNAAAAGAFVPHSGRLDWAAGETASKTVSLTLTAADPVEDDARIELRLSDPTGGATVGSATHVVHVLGASPGRISLVEFQSEVPVVREGQSRTIGVARRGGGNGSVSVKLRRVYVSQLGQAAGPEDFFGPGEVVLEWNDGETGARIYELGILDDRVAEPREYVRLELSEATGGSVIESASLEIAIDDSGNNGGGNSGSGSPPPVSGGSGGGGATGPLGALAPALLAAFAWGARRRRRFSLRSEA